MEDYGNSCAYAPAELPLSCTKLLILYEHNSHNSLKMTAAPTWPHWRRHRLCFCAPLVHLAGPTGPGRSHHGDRPSQGLLGMWSIHDRDLDFLDICPRTGGLLGIFIRGCRVGFLDGRCWRDGLVSGFGTRSFLGFLATNAARQERVTIYWWLSARLR